MSYPAPIPILVYHQIADCPKPRPAFSGLYVSRRSFERQMRLLKALGYTGLSLKDAEPWLRGEKSGKIVVITFDDGFQNVLTNAAPVLNELGFTATNFMVANQIGGSNVWDRDLSIPPTPCMTEEEVLLWHKMGHEVGAHTLDHVNLLNEIPRDALSQILDSKKRLGEIIGSRVRSFSYPYGACSLQLSTLVAKCDFSNAVTTRSARSHIHDNPYLRPRICIRRNHTLPEFLARIWLK
jgi:peptidoglycan/xylan/chitin deacetylase (PgdA/CDA1 family)